MLVRDALFGRRAVREYVADPVDEATIRRLIHAAIHAPNAVNAQPWAFTVVRSRPTLQCVSREARAHMLETMPAQHADRFRPRLSDPAFDIFYNAPALIVISARAERAMDRRGLRNGGSEPDAGRLRRRAWDVLDRLAPGLSTGEGKAVIDVRCAARIEIAPIIVGKPKSMPAPVGRLPPRSAGPVDLRARRVNRRGRRRSIAPGAAASVRGRICQGGRPAALSQRFPLLSLSKDNPVGGDVRARWNVLRHPRARPGDQDEGRRDG